MRNENALELPPSPRKGNSTFLLNVRLSEPSVPSINPWLSGIGGAMDINNANVNEEFLP